MCDKILVNVKKNGELRFDEKSNKNGLGRMLNMKIENELNRPCTRPFYT